MKTFIIYSSFSFFLSLFTLYGLFVQLIIKNLKKAASGLAVRFAKLTHYASVDSGSSSTDNNISTTSTKSHVATISGALSSLTSRSISLDKPNSSNAGSGRYDKKALAHFKQSVNSQSVGSTSTSLSTRPNRRYSVTTENMPKLTDLRKILHPEEERRDLETGRLNVFLKRFFKNLI